PRASREPCDGSCDTERPLEKRSPFQGDANADEKPGQRHRSVLVDSIGGKSRCSGARFRRATVWSALGTSSLLRKFLASLLVASRSRCLHARLPGAASSTGVRVPSRASHWHWLFLSGYGAIFCGAGPSQWRPPRQEQ